MSSKRKIETTWRQFIGEAAEVVAKMLVSTFEVPRMRQIPVREPSRAEIERWLRARQ